jgi:hypothetical protein
VRPAPEGVGTVVDYWGAPPGAAQGCANLGSGRLAQLGERRVRNAEVGSSSLLPSTTFRYRPLATRSQRKSVEGAIAAPFVFWGASPPREPTICGEHHPCTLVQTAARSTFRAAYPGASLGAAQRVKTPCRARPKQSVCRKTLEVTELSIPCSCNRLTWWSYSRAPSRRLQVPQQMSPCSPADEARLRVSAWDENA